MANAADEQRLKNLETRIYQQETRIAQLEAENASLKAPKSAPPAAPPLEEGTTVRTVLRDFPIPMPTPRQYEALIGIAQRAEFVPSGVDRAEFYSGFVGSFERLAYLRRLDGLNLQRNAREWALETEQWLKERGTPTEVMNGSFFAACVMCGDVTYCLSDPAHGVHAAYLGLAYNDGRRALPAWRSVLERNAPRPAVAAPRRPESSPPRTIYAQDESAYVAGFAR